MNKTVRVLSNFNDYQSVNHIPIPYFSLSPMAVHFEAILQPNVTDIQQNFFSFIWLAFKSRDWM